MGGFAGSPQQVIIVGGPIKYYTGYSSSNLYVQKSFGGEVHNLTIQNTHATDPAQFSFDNSTLHGELSAGESITVNVGQATSIYLKSTAGTAVIRVWGT
jgi:putative lipase involved disintegration of autophagic bodies